MRRPLTFIALTAIAALGNISAAFAASGPDPAALPVPVTTAGPAPYPAPPVLAGRTARSILRDTIAPPTTAPGATTSSSATTTSTSTPPTTTAPTTTTRRTPPPVPQGAGGGKRDDHDGRDEPAGTTTTTEPFTVQPRPLPATTQPFTLVPGPAPQAAPSGGSPLPYTGAQVTAGLAVAAALVAGGCVLVLVARRRPRHARGA